MTFRVLALTLGGFALMAALSALAGLGLVALGVRLSEAMLATVLLGYVFYVALLMWGFADRNSLRRPWLVVVLAGLGMTATSYLAPFGLPA